MDNSYYQAGGSGTFGLAWSNEAPAIHQDMIEGRLDHVPAINKLDCWLQLLLTAVLCLHLFDLNFKGLDFSACQAVYFQEFARGHESHPSLLPHHLTCSVRVCVVSLVFFGSRGQQTAASRPDVNTSLSQTNQKQTKKSWDEWSMLSNMFNTSRPQHWYTQSASSSSP